MELVVVVLLKFVKRRKHDVKRFSVYLFTEHIHDDCFKLTVKVAEQVSYGLSAGFRLLRLFFLLVRRRIEIAELLPNELVRAKIAILITAFRLHDIAKVEDTLAQTALEELCTLAGCLSKFTDRNISACKGREYRSLDVCFCRNHCHHLLSRSDSIAEISCYRIGSPSALAAFVEMICQNLVIEGTDKISAEILDTIDL